MRFNWLRGSTPFREVSPEAAGVAAPFGSARQSDQGRAGLTLLILQSLCISYVLGNQMTRENLLQETLKLAIIRGKERLIVVRKLTISIQLPTFHIDGIIFAITRIHILQYGRKTFLALSAR